MRALIDDHPDESYVLVYGDLDRFKVYNDLFGTQAGDTLLAAIGSMLRDSLPSGAVAARLRADHFVCCCSHTDFDPDNMLAALDKWFATYRAEFTFFVRLGIYLIDDPALDVSLMCDRALLALRAAKSGFAGSKYVIYDEGLRSTVLKEQELAGEMIAALEQGQFVPYFQPQYRYASGRMVGAEVLARWNHPVKGLLGPCEFIPVFERNGLIATFDYYIWDQACRCLREWIDERGIDRVTRLSVNLSRADLYRADLCLYLSGLIERYDLPFDLLHLEITESAYMEAPEQLIEVVKKLRSAGFIVEMDDFGSGYSSLNTLKDVPVDVLKLDMGFLDEHASSRGGLILASVVRMARWLDLPVIAEGVETQKQAAYLASIGCEYMQGFLFSRPIDRASFEQKLDHSSTEDLNRLLMENLEEDVTEFWNADSQLALIFNNYVGAAAIAEFDGQTLEIVRLNRELAEIFGIIEDDAAADRLRRDLLGLLVDEDREAMLAALRRTVEGERAAECEFRYGVGSGIGRWIRFHFRLLSRTGSIGILYLLAEETTEEQALRDRLVATTETIPGGLSFYEVRRNGVRLLDFSDAAADLTGCTREEYEAWSEPDALAVMYEDDRWIVEAALDELRNGAQRTSCTTRIKHRTEGYRWAHLSTSMVYRGEESFFAVVVAIDVTADKNNEQRLMSQNETQQRLYDAIPCGIVRYPASANPHIISVNKKACDLLGYASLAEYIADSGGDALMPIYEEDVRSHREVIEKLRNGSAPIDFSYRYYRRDGSIGWLEGTSALEVAADGEPLIQSAFVDVSDQREQSHERDLQRYAQVLCSVYEEIFELDSLHGTYRMLYSAKHGESTSKALPVEAAVERWLSHLPDAQDRVSLLGAIDECRRGNRGEPVSCTYKVVLGSEETWCQSTFLRVSGSSVLCCNKDVTAHLSAEDRKVVMRVADTMGKLPVGIAVFSLHAGSLYALYANDLMCTMFNANPTEFKQLIDRGEPLPVTDDLVALKRRCENGEKLKQGFDVEHQAGRVDAEPLDVRVQGRIVNDEHGSALLYLVVTDITEELRERRERAWQNERYRLLSEMTHKISFDYDSDSDTVLLYIDRTGNGTEAQVIPHYLETLASTRNGVVHPDSIDDVRQMFEEARAGATKVGVEYRADYYGRGYAWYRANLFVAHDGAGAWHLVGLIEDIEDERDLRYRAEYDATTGLSNHASAQDLITMALANPEVRAHSVCVVLDLDDFKWVNDNCGHIEGDTLLHTVGTVLRTNFRESDIIGRVGGDEFVMLLKQIDLEVVLRKLERVRNQISASKLSTLDRAPSISIGVYATQSDDKAYRDVFVKADEALYQAKRSGKNRIQIYQG